MIFTLLLFELLIISTTAFNKAPGTVIIKIGIPELIDHCFIEECQYNMDICIGVGRSFEDRCLWVPKRNFSGFFMVNQEYLVQESFKTKNIRSSFYFNANFTFHAHNKYTETIVFKDNLVHYAAIAGSHRVSLHSETYESIWIEITVKCDLGYYPPFQCTKECFGIPGQYECDSNGSVVCNPGYVLSSSTKKCVKDMCKANNYFCKNNSTCINDVNAIRCLCKKHYTGTECEIWDPCKEHLCKNSGVCIKKAGLQNYLCQCMDNYYGTYCEYIENPCKGKHCPLNSFCQHNYYEAICVKLTNDPKRSLLTSRQIDSTETYHRVLTTRVENSDIQSSETLIQRPVQTDFTIIIIVIFLLVFIICCFGLMFWIQLYKYFQKRIRCGNNIVVSTLPSVINRQKHKVPEYNIQKWCSMDEGAFSLWRVSQNNEFSTITYISGTNTKVNNSHETSLNKFKDFQSTFKAKKSTNNPLNDFHSKDFKSNSLENSEGRLEKMEDNNDENCLINEDSDTQYAGISFV